jgi:hypothetical protein
LAGILCNRREDLPRIHSQLEAFFGPVAAETPVEEFRHSGYYAPEMGETLWRQFQVFSALRKPEELVGWKLWSNRIEGEWPKSERGGRGVNIDPGYLAPGKLVLASTKDHAHRVYLGQGIFGEITLRIKQRRFTTWEWSYPDYVQAAAFFDTAYQSYLADLKESDVRTLENDADRKGS